MKKDCRKYFERLSEYLDGELDNQISKEIEEHMQDCPECRDCFVSLKRSIQLCKKAGDEEIPDEIRDRLRSNLRDCFDRRSQ